MDKASALAFWWAVGGTMSKFNRRYFLQSSAGYGFLALAIESYLKSLVFSGGMNALASSGGASDKFYVGVHIDGGPARWMFDLPLYTNMFEKSKLEENPNPMVITGWQYQGSFNNSATGEYKLKNCENLLLPPLWRDTTPTDLKDLVKSSIFIRGLKTLSIHPAWKAMFMPRIGSLSIPGIISNYASSTIPCINFGVDSFPLGNTLGQNSKIMDYSGNWRDLDWNSCKVIPKELILPFKEISNDLSEGSLKMKKLEVF